MITHDLSSPESRPVTKSAGPSATPVRFKLKKPAKEFASVMDQALHPKSESARAPKWAPRGRGNAGGSLTASDQMARRERPATPNDAETDFRSASARRDQVASPRANHAEATKASGNAHEEEPFTAGNKSQTTDNDQASATETSPNLLSNIIPFPTSPVIIPFPGTVNRGDGACGRAAGEPAGAPAQESPLPSPTDASADNDRTSNANGDGLDVIRLGLKTVQDGEHAGNIEAVDFRSPSGATGDPASSILPVSFGADATADQGAAGTQELSGVTPLPGEPGASENSAQPAAAIRLLNKLSGTRREARKAAGSTGLPFAGAGAGMATEAAGITAARQNRSMDSMTNLKPGNAFAGRAEGALEEYRPDSVNPLPDAGQASDFSPRNLGAMEWQVGRPVASSDRPACSSVSTGPSDPSGTVERISNLVQRETELVRQHSSDSMAVVLRPDASTELVIHLAQRHGQIEATVRCERGDFQHLNALWPQLQESLAQQKVRLAPLQEGTSSHSNFTHSGSSTLAGEDNHSRRQSSPDQPSLDDRPAPASAMPAHLRGRGGSRRRLTTSRPGWETWA